jgi:hypothetical protein
LGIAGKFSSRQLRKSPQSPQQQTIRANGEIGGKKGDRIGRLDINENLVKS